MNRLSVLGKRAGLVIAMLAVLAGIGANQAAASGAPASAHLFWTNWDLPIGHANADGTPAETPFINSPGRILYVAANAQHVYWSNQYGSIGRAKVDGSDVQPSLIPIPSGPARPAAIALDETYVYWVEESIFFEGSIGRAKLDGSEVNRAFITGVGRASGWTGLAVDGQHIYWASDAGIGRADINGQNAQNAYVPRPGGGSINSVAVDATHLYWTYDHRNATGADVFRAPLDNTSAHELLVFSPTDGPMQVAVDDQHVYFSRYGPDWIGRTDLDGANDNLDFLSTGVMNPVGLALAPAAAPSSNADLADLSLTESAFAFSPATNSYELQVGHATTDAHLTATLDDANATLTVNGNPATSGTAATVPLAVGPNTLSVVVTAEDGTTKTYTLTITRAATAPQLFWGGWYDGIGHANSDGTAVQREFIPGPGNQTFVAANDRHVYWTSLNGEIGRADVDGSDRRPSLITGVYGAAGIALDETYIYWLESDFGPASIGRAKLDGTDVNPNFITGVNASNGGLAVDDEHIYWAHGGGYGAIGRADIDGQNVQNEYVVQLGVSIDGVAVDATHLYWTAGRDGQARVFRAPLTDTSARQQLISVPGEWWMQLAIDGKHVYFSQYVSGWIGRADLNGANPNLEFVSTNGHEHGGHPVGIALTPALPSSNADLAGLSLTEGALAFSPATSSYELQVGHATTDAHLTATLDDPNATVTVNGNPATSGTAMSLPLAVGPNTLSVLVTAEDGTTKTYTLTITRAVASSNADLADLSLTESAFAFSPATSGYELQVGHATTDAHLTATLDDPNATVTVNGNPATSGTPVSVPLAFGPNTLSVVVTAEDGTKKTYTLTITRPAAPTLTVVASPAKPGSTKPEFTTNPSVQIKTTAPAGTTQVEISNDPGFGDAQSFPVASDGSYAWTLPGDGEHTVYVRFLGAGSQPTLNATVKLDATAPKITKARFVKRRNGRVWMTVAAVDSVSGVARLQFAPKRNHPWHWRSYRVKTSDRTKQPFIWVRTADGAGNVSAWKKIIIPAKRNR